MVDEVNKKVSSNQHLRSCVLPFDPTHYENSDSKSISLSH